MILKIILYQIWPLYGLNSFTSKSITWSDAQSKSFRIHMYRGWVYQGGISYISVSRCTLFRVLALECSLLKRAINMADKEEKYDPTRKETFDLINAELNSLYFQLKKTSPSSRTLQEAAEPFLKKPRGLRKKGSLSFSTKLAIYVGLLSLCISYLIYCEPINRFVRSTSRKAFTTVRP